MYTVPERQMVLRRACDVKSVRILVSPRIAIASTEHQCNRLAISDPLLRNLDVGHRYPTGKLHRAVEPHEFLGCVGSQFRMVAKYALLVLVFDEGEYGVGDRMGRCGMAGVAEKQE